MRRDVGKGMGGVRGRCEEESWDVGGGDERCGEV